MTKICKDCKHYTYKYVGYCNSPNNMEIDIVTGEKKRRWALCKSHRESGKLDSLLLETCGKRARWFEPK